MDISLYCDTVSPAAPAKQALGLGFTKFLIRRHLTTDQSPSILQIDAMARSPVKTRPRKTRLRKRRRTRRRLAGGDEGDGVDGGGVDGFEGSGDDGGFGGSFGGGGEGGGGWRRRWDFDGFGGEGGGGENWGDDESWGSSGFASDFIYEVLGWIALSNCVHFAFKKFVRSVTDGIGDAERAKVPDRLGSVC